MWSLIVSSQTAAALLHWQCRRGEKEEHDKIVVTQSDAKEEKVWAASGSPVSQRDMLLLSHMEWGVWKHVFDSPATAVVESEILSLKKDPYNYLYPKLCLSSHTVEKAKQRMCHVNLSYYCCGSVKFEGWISLKWETALFDPSNRSKWCKCVTIYICTVGWHSEEFNSV